MIDPRYNKVYISDMTKAEAIKPFRTATALAEALGITKGAVSNWNDDRIPREHELTIKYELRPDLFQKKTKAA